MDTFTFKNIGVGEKFKPVNVAEGKVLPDCPIYTKVEPFEFKAGRPLHNCTYVDGKGRTVSTTMPPEAAVVFA